MALLGVAVSMNRCWAGADGVQLRAGEAPPSGQIVLVDSAGVHFGPPPIEGKPLVETTVVPWDRIRSIDGTPDAAKYADIADQVWRARTRLERADFISAEPIFEQLFAQYKSQRGATAAVVAEGLLRCRLRRGAHILAIEPWLAMVRATATPRTPVLHEAWASEAGLAGVLDPATGLIPALPPIWLSWPSVDSFAKAVGPAPTQNPTAADARADALGQIYYQSARYEAGLTATLPELATNDPGVNIAWQIVQSRIGAPEQREAARKQLRDRLQARPPAGPPPPWLEAWCRAAIGRSLIREDGTEQKQAGIIELLNIPARFSRAHPYLSGLALAEASSTLRALGDHEGADVLARELAASYPSHPVNDWVPFRTFRPSTAPITAKAPAPKEGAIPDAPDATTEPPK